MQRPTLENGVAKGVETQTGSGGPATQTPATEEDLVEEEPAGCIARRVSTIMSDPGRRGRFLDQLGEILDPAPTGGASGGMRADVRTGGIASGQPVLKRRGVYAGYADTPEFRKWFGGSRVVYRREESDYFHNPEGHEDIPRVVYHTTNADIDFDIFRPDSRGAIWFRNDPTAAERISGRASAAVPCFLRIENPLEVAPTDSIAMGAAIDLAKARGHDGVILDCGNGDYIYTVFSPEQVKSPLTDDLFDTEGVGVAPGPVPGVVTLPDPPEHDRGAPVLPPDGFPPMEGRTLEGVAIRAEELPLDRDAPVLVYIDSAGKVRGLEEIHPRNFANIGLVRNRVAQRLREFGSISAAALLPEKVSETMLDAVRFHVRAQVLRDAIGFYGASPYYFRRAD